MNDSSSPDTLELCPPGIMDGWLIHSAAIRRGLPTWLLSGQVLYVRNDVDQELSFAHGVPEQTRLSAAVVNQDKRIRRSLLEQRKIRTPKGASFTLGKGLRGAERYANKIGYPVVLKPMIGDNSIEVMADINDQRDLRKGFDYFRTVPSLRKKFELSSYTLTTLFWPKEVGGSETRDDYRIVVEKQVKGKYLRFFVLDGQVVSCIHAPGGTWDPADGGGEILDDVHPRIIRIARRAAGTFPRLFALTVDIVLDDWTRDSAGQTYHVVELSERPWHYVRSHYIGAGVFHLAEETLSRSAGQADYSLPKPPAGGAGTTVETRWQGVSNPKAFAEACAEKSTDIGLSGSIWVEDNIGGVVKAHLHGRSDCIALISELSLQGGLAVDRVMSCECIPLPECSLAEVTPYSAGVSVAIAAHCA